MAPTSKSRRKGDAFDRKTTSKVGRGRAKNANFTNTSFKSRSVVVLQQSLTTSAPEVREQFGHHVRLLMHKSEKQRQQSLSHVIKILEQAAISAEPGQKGRRGETANWPQPPSTILHKVLPLVRDSSSAVRAQILDVLKLFPRKDISIHIESILLWVRLGLTNLNLSIRTSALDVLEWLCSTAGTDVVSCPGGWSKTLRCFAGILGWDMPSQRASDVGRGGNKFSSAWTSTSGSQTATASGLLGSKLLLRTIMVLAVFLRMGLSERDEHASMSSSARSLLFPLCQSQEHAMLVTSGTTDPFGYLDIFRSTRDEESVVCERTEQRMAFFNSQWRLIFEQKTAAMMREGGGLGRAATSVDAVLNITQGG